MTMDRTRAAGSHTRPGGSWPRFAGALLVLAVIAIGIPIGLIVASRIALNSSQPLPGIGSWDDIRSWLSNQRSSTEIARVALRILLSLAWLLWAALLVSVVSSLVESRPKLEHVHIPRLAMFDGLGAWIVAGLLVFGSLTPKVATASPPARQAAATAFATRSTTAPPANRITVAAPTRPGWAVVQPAESIEMFAARTLGDANRWPEVWDLNQGRPMDQAGTTWNEAWRLTPGWELQLPAATTPVATPVPAIAPEPLHLVTADTVADPSIVVHRIVKGDTLWDIVEDHYGYVDMDLIGFVAESGGIADPSNIPIGTDVVLPPLPAETPRQQPNRRLPIRRSSCTASSRATPCGTSSRTTTATSTPRWFARSPTTTAWRMPTSSPSAPTSCCRHSRQTGRSHRPPWPHLPARRRLSRRRTRLPRRLHPSSYR